MPRRLDELHGSVMVAMRIMGEVQVPGDHIIDMISMWYRVVATVFTMAMAGLMPIAAMGRRACCRVLRSDVEPMFIDMVAMQMVEMSVMEIVGMTIMDNGRMPAVGAMLMGVMLMDGVVVHQRTPFVSRDGVDSIVKSIGLMVMDGQ